MRKGEINNCKIEKIMKIVLEFRNPVHILKKNWPFLNVLGVVQQEYGSNKIQKKKLKQFWNLGTPNIFSKKYEAVLNFFWVGCISNVDAITLNINSFGSFGKIRK